MLQHVSCDIAFIPSIEEIYADSVNANQFEFDGLESQMEGKFRKGHFNGVGTIVKNYSKL